MRLAVPDLISPSYFPAIAAIQLGLVTQEGIDLDLELVFPVTRAADLLREGQLDFLVGAAHMALSSGQDSPIQLLAAVSKRTYWFLVVRPDLVSPKRSLLDLRSVRIGAAPGPDLALRQLLLESGIDTADADITIGPVPAADNNSVSFGVTAARALADGTIDAFWANGMGAEVAVRDEVGVVLLDARRHVGVPDVGGFTFPALMATTEAIHRSPDAAAAVVRALVRAQNLLRCEPERAAEAAQPLFPPRERDLIAELVRRDAPFYDPRINPEEISRLSDFSARSGWAHDRRAYDELVCLDMCALWSSSS